MPDIVLTREFPHPIEEVWRLLSDSEALATWLMPNDFKPELGHRFKLRTRPAPGFDGSICCEVTSLQPPHGMTWSWISGSIISEVVFELQPTPVGTRFSLQHRGFSGMGGLLAWFFMRRGWKKKLIVGLEVQLRIARPD